MIILNSGYTATVAIANGESLTIESRGGTTVTAVSGLGASGLLGTVDGTRTFGPYSAGVISVSAVGGDCSYRVNPTSEIRGVTDANGNTIGIDGLSLSTGRVTMVAIGDSMTARDEGAASAGLNGPRSDGINTLIETLMGGTVDVTGIYATGGFTIAQVAATHLPTALASSADVVFCMAGVNDCLAATETGEVLFARLQSTVINPILASGKKLVLGTVTYSASLTNAGITAMVTLNNLIRALRNTHPALAIADTNAVMSKASDGKQRIAPTACYDDVTHQNQAGAYWMAVEGENALKRLGVVSGTGKCRQPVANAYGIATNPRVAGNNATGVNKTTLATGITGTAPDGWTVNRTGATNTATVVTNSRTDNLDGGALNLALTLTNAGEPINVFPASGAAVFIRGTGASFTRSNSTVYVSGEVRRFSNGVYYKVIAPGTTAAAEPTGLPTSIGGVIADGTALWMRLPDFVNNTTYAMRLVTDYQVTAQSGLLAPMSQLRQYASGYANLSSAVQYYTRATNAFVAAGISGSSWGLVQGPVPTNLSAGYDTIAKNRVLTMRTPWARIHAETNIIEPQIRFAGAAGTTATIDILGSEIELAVM